MQSENIQRIEAKEEIIITLAEFFKSPTKEFYEEIKSGGLDDRLTELFKATEYRISSFELKQKVGEYKEFEQNYLKCFSGVSTPYAPPIESIYKKWTDDPTAQVTHANSKGYLMGDSALHIRYLFEQYKVEIPEEYRNMPDHLTLLLEFWTFLRINGSPEQLIQYLKDHFDWLNEFKQELVKVENSDLYIEVVDIVNQMVNEELKYLNQNNLS